MPLTRRLALLLAVEGLALIGVGAWYAVASLSDRSQRAPAELEAGAAVLTGLVLLAGSVLYLFATPELRDTFRER